MKKVFSFISIIIIVLASCNKEYEKALKSQDGEFILATADSLFNKEKWANAIDLYKRSIPFFAGKKEATHIAYQSAMANFKDKNYRLAGVQFKQFHDNFQQTDERAEEALFQSAYCFYLGSSEYNLDQENTYSALKELQNYIDTYPNSERISEANQLIDQLQFKLEKKAFEIAKFYYKTTEYVAASISFDNMLEDYPDTSLREEAMMYSLRAKHDWAVDSRLDRRRNYIKNVRTQYRLLFKEFPNSEFKKEADKLMSDLDDAEQEVVDWENKLEEIKANQST